MTFYHFVNVTIATFAPLYILFKYSSLSEAGSIWRCSWAFGAYIFTQLCKYLVVASLMIPPPPSIDCALDCLGLFYVLSKQQKASLPQVKILSRYFYSSELSDSVSEGVALGWSFGESVLTRLTDFYINARSPQFDWKHIGVAVDANICLIQHVCLCWLLWLISRGSGSGTKIVINSATKKPVIVIGLYVLGLSFHYHSLVNKLVLVTLLAIGTLFTVDLRK